MWHFGRRRAIWRGRRQEFADGCPGKIGNQQPFITTLGLAGVLRTKSTDGVWSRPACGQGRRELGTGELRQAGPAKWATKTADRTTSNCEKIEEAPVSRKPSGPEGTKPRWERPERRAQRRRKKASARGVHVNAS